MLTLYPNILWVTLRSEWIVFFKHCYHSYFFNKKKGGKLAAFLLVSPFFSSTTKLFQVFKPMKGVLCEFFITVIKWQCFDINWFCNKVSISQCREFPLRRLCQSPSWPENQDGGRSSGRRSKKKKKEFLTERSERRSTDMNTNSKRLAWYYLKGHNTSRDEWVE